MSARLDRTEASVPATRLARPATLVFTLVSALALSGCLTGSAEYALRAEVVLDAPTVGVRVGHAWFPRDPVGTEAAEFDERVGVHATANGAAPVPVTDGTAVFTAWRFTPAIAPWTNLVWLLQGDVTPEGVCISLDDGSGDPRWYATRASGSDWVLEELAFTDGSVRSLGTRGAWQRLPGRWDGEIRASARDIPLWRARLGPTKE